MELKFATCNVLAEMTNTEPKTKQGNQTDQHNTDNSKEYRAGVGEGG